MGALCGECPRDAESGEFRGGIEKGEEEEEASHVVFSVEGMSLVGFYFEMFSLLCLNIRGFCNSGFLMTFHYCLLYVICDHFTIIIREARVGNIVICENEIFTSTLGYFLFPNAIPYHRVEALYAIRPLYLLICYMLHKTCRRLGSYCSSINHELDPSNHYPNDECFICS